MDIREKTTAPGKGNGKPQKNFLGVMFDCCNVYVRVYKHKYDDKYTGTCYKCGKRVNFIVGEGGTSSRFFTAK